MPDESTRLGTYAKLAAGLLHGGKRALGWRDSWSFSRGRRGRGSRGAHRRGGGFPTFLLLVDVWWGRVGDEVGWEDILEGYTTVVTSLSLLVRLEGDGTGG